MDDLLLALGNIAKAVGMSEIAEKSHVNRQSLYRSLAPGGKPLNYMDTHTNT